MYTNSKEGLFHPNDVKRLGELGEKIRKTFAYDLSEGAEVFCNESADELHLPKNILWEDDSFWCTPAGTEKAVIYLKLHEEKYFDRIVLQEQISEGQRIESFCIEGKENGCWKTLYNGTTVGYKKICCIKPIYCDEIRITIKESRYQPTLRKVGIFKEV